MAIGLQAALLLTIAWLPGAAIFRAPVLDRERRASLDIEERAFWQVILSIAISLSVCLALAAAGRYTFDRLLLIDAGITATALVIWRGRLRMPGAKRPGLSAALPLLLIVVGIGRFFPPSEYIIGGKDPGVYMNEGIQIAQRGALVIEDPAIAAIPRFARDLFIPRHLDLDGRPRTDYYSTRFMGFFVKDPDAGTVVGQFPHLFPASIAIGYGIDGLTGARRALGVWAILGVLAVYFLGARLLGKPAAAVAGLLLTVHVIQIWFSRYPNAEMLMQAFVFAALLANARGQIDGDRFFAPVAGGLLGLLMFLRMDTVLAAAGVSTAAVLALMAGKRLQPSLLAAFAVPVVLTAAYLAGPMRAYAQTYFLYFQRLYLYAPWWQYALVALAPVLVTGAIREARRRPALRELVAKYAPDVVAVMLLAGGLYALFLRHPEGALAAHDAYALRTFANVYFTVPGVLAAALAFALVARDRFWRDPATFVTLAVFAFSVFYKPRIVPEHFWMARRFLPVILPGALLFVTAAAFAVTPSRRPARILRWTLGGTLILLLATTYARASSPVVPHTEYEGLIPRIEALAGRFGPDDLILVESRNAGGDVHTLAAPLAYIYAKNVLLLSSPRPDKAALEAFIAWARARYARVLFIGGAGTDLLSRGYALRPVATERFEAPEFETSTDARPRLVTRKDFEFGVYEFLDARPAEPDSWFDLDVGSHDDLHVLRFHAREPMDGRTFRWTRETSYVSVTTVSPTATELTLVLNDGGRPAAAIPASVEVFFHNQHLGTVNVAPGGFRPYTFRIPKDLVERAALARDPVELRLKSTTWNPRDVLGVDDSRELGVMVDRVTIK